jgi:subtilisin family serine protease
LNYHNFEGVRKLRYKLLILASSFAAIALSNSANAQIAGEKIADSYICVFKAKSVGRGGEQGAAAAAARAAGAQVSHVYTTALQGFAARIPDQAVERMKAADARIDYCEQDQVMSLVPIRIEAKPSRGGGGSQPAQTTPWGVIRVLGSNPTFSSGTGGKAWVIDTGIDPQHPDLTVDTANSRSFVSTTSYVDQNGHGTHVAGTIAARNNTIGVVGVAPGATVVAIRVLDARGSGTTSGVIAGVDYVANRAAAIDVANMSLGGGISAALDTAVATAAAKGIRFAIAAGNSTAFAGNSSPARVDAPNVFTVSAFGSNDVFASFSNYGNPPIDFAEPGVSITSTWLSGGYNTISGTSMAAPHLAGLLLLGNISIGGYVTGDRDSSPDPIGVR